MWSLSKWEWFIAGLAILVVLNVITTNTVIVGTEGIEGYKSL